MGQMRQLSRIDCLLLIIEKIGRFSFDEVEMFPPVSSESNLKWLFSANTGMGSAKPKHYR
jgi:hypothetical protein